MTKHDDKFYRYIELFYIEEEKLFQNYFLSIDGDEVKGGRGDFCLV